MAEGLVEAIADLLEEEALRITEARLATGEVPQKLLEDSREAMKIVGKRFEAREYFIPDLIYSGEILQQIAKIVKPRLRRLSKLKSWAR